MSYKGISSGTLKQVLEGGCYRFSASHKSSVTACFLSGIGKKRLYVKQVPQLRMNEWCTTYLGIFLMVRFLTGVSSSGRTVSKFFT